MMCPYVHRAIIEELYKLIQYTNFFIITCLHDKELLQFETLTNNSDKDGLNYLIKDKFKSNEAIKTET